jgi:hypothetical protein
MRLVVLQDIADALPNEGHGGFNDSNRGKLHHVLHFLCNCQGVFAECHSLVDEVLFYDLYAFLASYGNGIVYFLLVAALLSCLVL